MIVTINADDLGYSKKVNSKIFEYVERGLITSASIMSNAPYFSDAIMNMNLLKNISIGIHLNLTEFVPFTNSICQFDITSDNSFNNNIRSSKYLNNYSFLKAVYDEWNSQLKYAKDHGINITHIDSHHHVHTIPQLMLPLKMLQITHNIKKVRISRNICSDYSFGLNFKKYVWNCILKNIIRSNVTDHFCSFGEYFEYHEYFKHRSGYVELMCHPGNDLFEEENSFIESMGHWIPSPSF